MQPPTRQKRPPKREAQGTFTSFQPSPVSMRYSRKLPMNRFQVKSKWAKGRP